MRRASWISIALVGCVTTGPSVRPTDADVPIATPDFGLAPPHDAAVGDLAGEHWDGTIDGAPFPSGSRRVQIILDHATGDGPRTGVVVFGMAAPPTPARDPSVGYPLGFDDRTDAGADTALEGLVYPILEGSETSTHLHITISQVALWERWCELQTPVPFRPGDTEYACLPDGSGGRITRTGDDCVYRPATGASFMIDCGRMELCESPGYCACTVDGCVARSDISYTFELDIAGPTASGTVSLPSMPSVSLTTRS